MTKKYFSGTAIALGAFIGGPLPPSLFISHNFTTLGDKKRSRNVLISGYIFTILLILGLPFIPEPIINKIPNLIIPAIYTGIYSGIFHSMMKDKVLNEISEGAEYKKTSQWLPKSLIFMVVLLAGIIGVYFIKDSLFYKSIYIKNNSNEIVYNHTKITESRANEIGQAFIDVGFFSDEYEQSVTLEKYDDITIIQFYIDKKLWRQQREELKVGYKQILELLRSKLKTNSLSIEIFDSLGNEIYKL